jgi:hypothetical protein
VTVATFQTTKEGKVFNLKFDRQVRLTNLGMNQDTIEDQFGTGE